MSDINQIPRSRDDDYSTGIIEQRQLFIEEHTGTSLDHTKRFSFDPHEMEGNIENFWGVAQIPIGVAGPLLVNGEHAQGEFYVPMATVEGTMLASYNRGMKVIKEAGGVLTTVSQESMDDENPALRVSVSNSKGDEDMDEEDALMLERLTGKCSCNVL